MERSGAKLRQLHIAENLEDLNGIIDPGRKISKTKATAFTAKTIQKLYDEGTRQERLEKDEEMAYIFYMRFLTAVQCVKSIPILKDEFKARVSIAISQSEELSESLKKRYEVAKDCQVAERRVKELELLDATKNITKRNGSLSNGFTPAYPTAVEEEVTADELKTLMDKRATRFLLMDTRSPADFASSHPKHPDSISISNVILAQGLSANALGTKIKYACPESYEAWSRRATFDLIILYDWISSYEKRDPTLPLFVLYDAMTEWDPSTTYKGKIKILQGGIRHFYHKYPSYFTNPSPWSSNGPMVENGKAPRPVQISLSAISYPSLDDGTSTTQEENNNPNKTSKTIKTNPTVNRSNKPSHLISQDLPTAKPATNGISNGDKTAEEHGRDVAAALDDLISVSKKTRAAEEEWRKVQEHNPPAQPELLKEKLNETERYIEEITQQLLAKTNQYDELKAHFERSLETERANRTFPSFRLTPMESEIAAKEKQKEELANHVKKIREERKRKEAAGLFNGPTPAVNGHHSDTSITQPHPPSTNQRGGAPRPSLPSTRPSSEDVTPKIYTEKLRPEGEQQRSNAALKRSHSNPNLAQMSFDEQPTFNRSQKPQSRRDFPTVSSTQRSHRTGLKNLGNTCYMNSIVQCLSHTRDLAAFLTSEDMRRLGSGGGKTRGEVTKEMGMTIQQLHQGHRCIAPEELKRVIGKYHAPFQGFTQHDSHELLTFLLDWMHEELNKATVKKLKEQNNDNVPHEVASVTFWKDFLSSNDSHISKLFAGVQRSSLKCHSCQKESVTFGAFYFLSIPMPTTGNKTTLASCLELYMSPEILRDLKCEHCKVKGETEKKFDLWRLPKYLIIHLQRFHHNGDGNCRKRINEVECPRDGLDLSPWLKGSVTTRATYDMYAISNHYGSMEGGHYTAFCRNTECWTKFDDSEVSIISMREVCTTAAYILFYQVQD